MRLFSVLDCECLARAGLAVDDPHRPGGEHVGDRSLTQGIVLGAYETGVEVEEVPAHQSVSSPSSDTDRAWAWGTTSAASLWVSTVEASASALDVAGDSP